MKDIDNTINFRNTCNSLRKNFSLRLEQLYSYYEMGLIDSSMQHSNEVCAFYEIVDLIKTAKVMLEISDSELDYQLKAIEHIYSNEGGH